MLKLLAKARSSKKGFTLVELIVVLVILAILAAILVPSLTGYIDKANEKRITAEARSAYVAAQSLISESYGVHKSTQSAVKTDSNVYSDDILELAEDTSTSAAIAVYLGDGSSIKEFIYTDGTKFAKTQDGNEWTVTDAFSATTNITTNVLKTSANAATPIVNTYA